jgi:lipoyl(octanoyl) transferase
MMRPSSPISSAPDLTLQVYVLGTVDFEAAVRLQHRLHYEICETRSRAALILCEHLPLITIGRQGSHAHIRWECGPAAGKAASGPPIRWVNRGGGCILHMPGQLAVYPIFPLDRLELDITGYLQRLAQACLDVTGDFSLRMPARAEGDGVWVGDRLLAVLGVTVHDWVSSFGAYLNVQPALEYYRLVQTIPGRREPMTSLERERRGPVRPSTVRQRLIEQFQARFGFTRSALFSDHPALAGSVRRCDVRTHHAVASSG